MLFSRYLLSYRTVTPFQSTALVPNSAHAILSNMSPLRRKLLIDNGSMVVGLLPLRCTQEALEEEDCAQWMKIYWFTDLHHQWLCVWKELYK